MQPRFSITSAPPGSYKAMVGLEQYLATSAVEKNLLHLIKLRASQINGCAYCIDMHWKDLRAAGESEQRLYGMDAWAESPYYTDRERAALEWAEALTKLDDGHVPDAVFDGARRFFSEKELADLTLCVVAINGCAYCIDMHWKDLRAEGENEQRLYGLDAWAESPYYTDRERAALAWTEAVTRLEGGHVPDAVFDDVRRFFSDRDLADLTLCIVAINGWNRLNIAFRTPAGTYRPGQFEKLKKTA